MDIRLCNKIGWKQIADTIDANEEQNHYSQDLYVIDRGRVEFPELWALVKCAPCPLVCVKTLVVVSHPLSFEGPWCQQ